MGISIGSMYTALAVSMQTFKVNGFSLITVEILVDSMHEREGWTHAKTLQYIWGSNLIPTNILRIYFEYRCIHV